MDIALLVARVLLAAVFAVAGVAKLLDRAGSRQAVVDFGGPERLAAPLAILLPLAEVAVAIALIPKPSAWYGAIGALALLLAFIAAIGLNIARGRQPDCHCFGQLHSSPAGWPALGRNAALAAVAAFVAAAGRTDPGLSAVAWLGDLSGAEIAALVGGIAALGLLTFQTLLLFNVLRQNGRLLLRVDALERQAGVGETSEAGARAATPQAGLPVGSPAPGFQLSGLYGETLTLDALRASGRPVLLIFGDPNCGPCNALLPEIGRWQREYAAQLTTAVITTGTEDQNRPKSTEHGITNVLLQQGREVAEAYLEQGTPSAVLVNADGTIGSPLAAGAEAIGALVTEAVGAAPVPQPPPVPAAAANGSAANGAAAPAPPGPKIGDRAPTLRLPDLNGTTVSLNRFRGSQTLVLFWNPGCGFCQQMLDDLRAWDANPQEGAPKLLVVATGDKSDLVAMGLRAPVVLDPTFSKAAEFGANGTPMAVLVDERGKIASEVAAGAPAVMALARGEPAPSLQAEATAPAAVQPGQPAPPLRLPDLDGRTVDLADFRGRETLVLFWNPGCGFCEQMLDALRAWEVNTPAGAPQLLVVSTGGVDENRSLGLRSPVVLDQGFGVGSAFGASGTPMAVLVDADSRVASEVAAGAPAVLALARGENPAASAAT